MIVAAACSLMTWCQSIICGGGDNDESKIMMITTSPSQYPQIQIDLRSRRRDNIEVHPVREVYPIKEQAQAVHFQTEHTVTQS